MTDVALLKQRNAQRWANTHVRADRIREFDATAARLCAPAAKARYQGVTDRLIEQGLQPVPWWFIAVVSMREYGGPPHWDRQLGQGDPLARVSIHEPKGRGPFLTHPGDVTPGHDAWTRGCLDALIECAPHAAKWDDWSISGVLTLWEKYNGLGYAARGRPSPYIWSGTDQYVSGKYVRDGVYDPNHVDTQPGCAGLLLAMMALDPTITFTGTEITPPISITPVPTDKLDPSSIVNPAKGSVRVFIASILAAIFKKGE